LKEGLASKYEREGKRKGGERRKSGKPKKEKGREKEKGGRRKGRRKSGKPVNLQTFKGVESPLSF